MGYALARGLYDRGCLGKVLCYSADASVDFPGHLIVQLEPRIARKVFGLGYRIGGYFPTLPLRRMEERLFDRRASRHITREWGDTLFCTKPVNPDTILRARRLEMFTCMSTSILHPRFNLEMVNGEQKRLGVTDASVYTDELRVRHLERALCAVDRVIAANAFFKENYGKFGVAPEKFLIPEPERPHEGVDSGYFTPPHEGVVRDGLFRVLHVSHMTLIKGVQYLIEAWRRIEAEIEGELVLVGSMDANVRDLVRRSGVRKIRMTGAKDPTEEYRRATVFVSPSLSDAGPNTVFEAMACGTPAIVSNHCGVSRFIRHGVDGFTYKYDDVERLSGLIMECYREPVSRLTLAKEALKTARQFPILDYSEEWLSLLDRARTSSLREAAYSGARHG